MVDWLIWYLLVLIIGVLAMPLAAWLLPALKDKGYAFTKSLGLLFAGFIFWLLVNFKILQNNSGGVIISLLVVLGCSIWVSIRNPELTWRSLFKSQTKLILLVEILYLLAFALMAIWRAANPNISGTEKPMELAFINAILKSPTFPPQDPWLSGYAISYYYFGYVLVAMLIQLGGISSGVGFNLAVSMVFAMTAIGAYGIVFNVIHAIPLKRWLSRTSETASEEGKPRYLLPLFAPLFTLIISNVEGLLEFLHARGLFWTRSADGTLISPFWSWLDIQELIRPPMEPFSWEPNRIGGILWWRASRVLSDYRMSGSWVEVIDEFPFFSFLLSDLHPHVLALPFAMLALALALNLILGGARGEIHAADIHLHFSPRYLVAVPILIGGMAFLNTWDFPIYLGILLLAYLLIRIQSEGWNRDRIGELLIAGLVLGILSVLCYLPFFLGFKSQAGGVVPSLVFYTRGVHYWVMFGTLLIPIFLGLIIISRKGASRGNIGKGFLYSGILLGGISLLALFLSIVALNLSNWGAGLSASPSRFLSDLGIRIANLGFLFSDSQGLSGEPAFYVILEALVKRLQAPGTWLTVLILFGVAFGLLNAILDLSKNKTGKSVKTEKQEAGIDLSSNPIFFWVLLIVSGALITIIPEFVYLRDQFGTRMNTIFKFYYQGWVLWSLAASIGVILMLQKTSTWSNWIKSIVVVVTILIGLCYPVFGIRDTFGAKNLSDLTLDGTEYLGLYQPDEYAAMQWLYDAPAGVIAESVGGSYSAHARMSTHSGHQNIIGWTPHEGQWGRGPVEFGTRIEDVAELYQSRNWLEAQTILDRYDVRYVVVGDYERSLYQVFEQKFMNKLPVLFQNNSVTIYGYNGNAYE